jgi:membrane fusion protein, multidrug efflux system
MSGAKRPVLLYLGGVVLLVVLAGGIALLFHSRSSQAREEIDQRRQVQAVGPKVLVVSAKRSAPSRTITVQSEAHAYAEVTLYAKIAGYLREIKVDKGDQVKGGQVLARIEAPEVDAQTVAAEADARYKKVIAQRAEVLVSPGVLSAQDRDVAVSNSEVANANEKSSQTLKGYELLRAPFDGTVTARFADPGALLQNAANAQSGALPIVTVAQIDTLRVYGYVDQRDAPFIKVGDEADVKLPERPDEVFAGKVTRISNELDPRTRMMLVEVDLDNHAHKIVAGSFVDTVLHLTVPSYVEVPAAALILRGKSPFVALVGNDDKVKYSPVTLYDDDGEWARITAGLEEGQRVAMNLGDSVAEGGAVQPVDAAAGGPPAGGPPAGGPNVAKSK